MAARRTAVIVQDLVQVGVALGADVAERLYLALASEPLDRYGNKIDWTVIQRAIVQGRTP